MRDIEPDRDTQETQRGADTQERVSTAAAAAVGVVLLVAGFILGLFRQDDRERRDEPLKASTQPEGEVDQEDLEAGYEQSTLSVRGVVISLIGLLILAGITFGAVTWLQAALTHRVGDLGPPPGVADQPTRPVPNIVQARAASGQELAEMRGAEEAILTSFAVVDEKQGIVRIPIDVAMELLAERGLPARQTGTTEERPYQGLVIPLDSSSGRAPDQVYDYWSNP